MAEEAGGKWGELGSKSKRTEQGQEKEQEREERVSSPFHNEPGTPRYCQVTEGQILDKMPTGDMSPMSLLPFLLPVLALTSLHGGL